MTQAQFDITTFDNCCFDIPCPIEYIPTDYWVLSSETRNTSTAVCGATPVRSKSSVSSEEKKKSSISSAEGNVSSVGSSE